VRAALALKGIEYEYRPINLIKNGGEQVVGLMPNKFAFKMRFNKKNSFLLR
jgi:hypothetical protein